MQAFELTDISRRQAESGWLYQEFLRVPSLSAGVYRLPAGAEDLQNPHGEDEVYYVLSGRAWFTSGGEDTAVQTGSILFVPANEKHRFHSIEEDLTILVFFSPAES